MSGGPDLIGVDEHVARILAAVSPLPAERVRVREAADRVLAHDLIALQNLPAFESSAMDGFAVRYAEVAAASETSPVVLDVVADLPAGSGLDPAMGPGQAVRLMTGSAVPTDADTVVPFEHTAEGLVDELAPIRVLQAPARRGRHVRQRGDDVAVGEVVVRAGTRLGPRQVAAALSAGHVEVDVIGTPRVAVLSTGSELVSDGSPLERGQIPESNGAMLAQLVTEAGCSLVRAGSVPDDPELLAKTVAQLQEQADVVVLTGGVSAGAYDVVKAAFAGTGARGPSRMGFWKVRMQPGKPQGFGVSPSGHLLFGLPGNPVSAAVSWEVFVRPALLAMQGRRDTSRRRMRLPAAVGWSAAVGRRQYVPVVIDHADPAQWRVRPAWDGPVGSHRAGSLARADGYAVVPEEQGEVAAGDLVDVWLIA